MTTPLSSSATSATIARQNYRLSFLYLTRSPLSHISEALSTTSFLVESPIIQPDGRIENVFQYSGNAVRGQWRDLSATYLLERLGNARVPLHMFHLLFSGGAISGEQKTDIAAARRMREALPHLSLFGGGVGNQILAGKLRVSCLYPVCVEAIPVLPEELHEPARLIEYRGITYQASFTRKDDTKDVRLIPHLTGDDTALLESGEKKKKIDSDVSTQMRMTSELLAPGVHLFGEVDCLDVSEVELGCLTAAIHAFSRSPVLGGQGNKGHGRVSVDVRYTNLDNGDKGDFLSIKAAGMPLLAPIAEQAKQSYDQHLRAQYDALLSSQSSEIRQLLSAA
jgi:hypothetical protein